MGNKFKKYCRSSLKDEFLKHCFGLQIKENPRLKKCQKVEEESDTLTSYLRSTT